MILYLADDHAAGDGIEYDYVGVIIGPDLYAIWVQRFHSRATKETANWRNPRLESTLSGKPARCIMPLTTFDTLKYVRRLEKAGMSPELAEVQAEVLTEAFRVNLESLVTKDYLESRLDARFAEQRAYLDTRFAEQDARIDTRFAEQDARIDTRFAEQDARFDSRFNEQNSRFESRFAHLEAKIDGNFRLFLWSQAIVMSAVVYPYLERLLA